MIDRFPVRQSVFATAVDSGQGELPGRLCDLLRDALGMDGVTISLLSHTPFRQLFCASDDTALRLEELQFELAEGPCVSASDEARPVVVDDLHGGERRWPVFGPLAREQLPDIGALFAFPMRFRQHVLGSIDMFRHAPDVLTKGEYEDCATAADAVAVVLLDSFRQLMHGTEPLPWEPADVIETHWATTHRAAALLAMRMDLTIEEAMSLLRACAFGAGRSLPEVSAGVLRQTPY